MERIARLDEGIELAYDDVGEGPPVIFVHGWPETRYSWRHTVPVVAAAGYRAIAYDCRGYGGSSKPANVEAYGIEAVVADLTGLVASLDLERPVIVGHDWGSIIVWTAAVLHPELFRAVVSINVPYRGWCVGFPTTDYMQEHMKDRFGYVLYFQKPGAPEASFAADPDRFLSRVYRNAAMDPDFMTAADFAVYRQSFVAGGMAGPINYYRNIDANHRAMAHTADAEIVIPALMIAADSDPVLPVALVDGMERWIDDLDVAVVVDSGHWTQQEQPDQVNSALVAFLDGLSAS